MTTIRTGNRQLMRELNMSLVFKVIRESEYVSHADIKNKTRLSAGTVTSIIQEFKEQNFLKDVGPGESTIGRRPTLLKFNSEARYVISAAFVADETALAILDLAGNILSRVSFSTGSEDGPKAVFNKFARRANKLLKDMNI